MKIRKAIEKDLETMMEIYAHGRAFMAEHGNPRQWGATNWPPRDLIRSDIRNGNSYVCVNGDEKIVGAFFFICGDDVEPTYRTITDGAWHYDGPYGVVHRIATDHSEKGIGTFCILWALRQCGGHLRIDTHGDNVVMQNLFKKLGFERCGTIYIVEDDEPRLAFEIKTRIEEPEESGRN